MATNAEPETTTGQILTDTKSTRFSVLKDVQALWYTVRELAHDHFRLAALEAQRAGKSLVAMIVTGITVAVLLNGAWLGLLAAIGQRLIENGMAVSSAILLAVVFNLLLALLLWGVICHKSRYLQFPALLNSLRPVKPPTEERPDEPV
jgi:hypothetical protein